MEPSILLPLNRPPLRTTLHGHYTEVVVLMRNAIHNAVHTTYPLHGNKLTIFYACIVNAYNTQYNTALNTLLNYFPNIQIF